MNAESNEVAGNVTALKPKATDVLQVTMDDGRVVSFSGKRKLNKDYTVGADGTVSWVFDLRNGKSVKLVVGPDDKLSDGTPTLAQLAGHGGLQKVGDEIASSDPEYTIDDAAVDVESICERIAKGEWSVKREGGGGNAGVSILIKALMEFRSKSLDEVKAFLADKSPADKKKLREFGPIKTIVDRLESEKLAAAGGAKPEELLAGF